MAFRAVAVSSSFLVAIALLSSAQADRPAKILSADSQQDSAVHLRDTKLTLGKAHAFGIAAGPAAATPRQSKTEMSVTSTSRAAKKPVVVARALSAYEQAAEELRSRAAQVDPTLTGRGEVSFVVGKKGEPLRAAVYGLSPALDQALTQHLTTLRFPSQHAGQHYTAKFTLRASSKAKMPPRVRRLKQSRKK